MNGILSTPARPDALRDELQDLVLRDLLGPAGGPAEEVDERRVRDRYLVGMLAPRRLQVIAEAIEGLCVGGDDAIEDGTAEAGSPPATLLHPSSFGLTCSVDGAAQAIAIKAGWGQYERAESQYLKTPTGSPKRVWRRVPREGSLGPIPLREGSLDVLRPVPEEPEVHVRGLVRRRGDHWVVTLFLVNSRAEPATDRDAAWLFQPELMVEAADGAPIFHPHPARRATRLRDPAALEDHVIEMMYRNEVEFAVGHGVSTHAEVAPGHPGRAVRVRTRVVPLWDVPRTEAPTPADFASLARVVLDMKDLGETSPGEVAAKVRPLVDAYAQWIDALGPRLEADPSLRGRFRQAGETVLRDSRAACHRVRQGVELLERDPKAAEAFVLMNRAMHQQRVRSILATRVRRGEKASLDDVDQPRDRTWYPFQLGFILVNLPGITDLAHPDRSDEGSAIADLLWFPTGGGKTEAYLGLSAYTMVLRRLQGDVAGRTGREGVAVLMRYTLRVLTVQQFQRAAALICACEALRREAVLAGDRRWGDTPFRIGLWVGRRTTPNRTSDSADAIAASRGQGGAFWSAGGGGTPAQLTYCPWCGSAVEPGRHMKVVTPDRGAGRTYAYCGDPTGACLFTERRSPAEGIPIVVVDEEIYRLLPAMLVATVDKFAQLPWNGATQMLFGQVNARCSRHGFRSPEIEDANTHPRKGSLPAARSEPHPPLRPPDLIIQDELHLISGPLGSLVGLYESAIDRLCGWEVNGRTIRPKLVVSTATVRRADTQVHALFVRRVSVFPPPGLDVSDNFFAVQRPPGPQAPGRRYMGLCAPGKSLTTALIRIYVALLSAAQQLYERVGAAADPWMTLVGYFNSLRELGGMRRLLDDHVAGRLRRMDQRGLARRSITVESVQELTSRRTSADIPQILDRLEVPFDPASKRRGVDALLATNMISVGVDVKRLGLMVVMGQPKTTAEYIQATSRVGRGHPGLVVTLTHWSRPRDLSHYERFEHYHATFYEHVEALSVTPFAPRAIDRGLSALLVALVRLAGEDYNANGRAGQIDRSHPHVKAALDAVTRRAHEVGGRPVRDRVEQELTQKLDQWLATAKKMHGGGVLGYEDRKDGRTIGLLRRPESGDWQDFTCLTSLRDVEPKAGLILDVGDAASSDSPIEEDTSDAPGDDIP